MKATTTNCQWLYEDVKASARIGADGGFLVVEWPDLVIRASTDTLEIIAGANFPEQFLRKVQKGVGPALQHYVRGGLAFHGAAVSLDDVAVLLVGPSGAGKSTMAAALCSKHGAELLADDVIIGRLDAGLVVSPLEDTHWLTAGSIAAVGLEEAESIPDGLKGPVLAHAARRPSRVAAIVSLAFDENVTQSARLSGREAFQVVADAMVRAPIDTHHAIDDFDRIANVCQTVPVYRFLRRADLFATLDQTSRRVVDLLRGTDGTQHPLTPA